MSLIVETGTAGADSEAYASVTFSDLHHANLGNTLWATLLIVEKEQALRRSASFMCQSYRMRWKGYRVNATQALDWPRYDVSLEDLGFDNLLPSDAVPDLVIRANAELALIAAAGDLNPTVTQSVVSKQVGPIKVVYDANSPSGKKYVAVMDILRPLFASVGGVSYKLRRT